MLVHEAVTEHARARPEAPAIRYAGSEITYEALERWAGAFAEVVIAEGATAERLVGLIAPRSAAAIAAILGVMKSGAAYVPIDPSYPPERIGQILDDAAPSLECVLRGGDVPSPAGAGTIVIDEVPPPSGHARLPRAASPGNLAYITYTSGSTGRPKGVMVEHRNLSAVIPALVHEYRVGPGDRVLQFAPLGWDTSVSEIFRALWAGACLCVAPSQLSVTPDALVDFLREERVNKAVLSTALLRVSRPSDLPDLDTLIASGERCTTDIVDRWASGRRLINAYGSTEGTLASTYAQCVPNDPRPPTIGRPIPTAEVFLLDQRGRPVPAGEVGEIHLGGMGVARGYYRQPDLTAERFVPNVLGRLSTRLFRTRDLGRTLEDGNLEFVGRVDHEVKVRGARVEPGDVEAALRRCTGVEDAVVIPYEMAAGGTELAAFVVASSGSPALPAIREQLRQMVPAYMIPQKVRSIDRLPLDSHGKLDRGRLRQAASEGGGPAQVVASAGAGIADRLGPIWCALFEVDDVDLESDFLQLGGSSLLAMRMLARVEAELGVKLTMEDLLDNSTVGSLAALIAQRGSEATGTRS